MFWERSVMGTPAVSANKVLSYFVEKSLFQHSGSKELTRVAHVIHRTSAFCDFF